MVGGGGGPTAPPPPLLAATRCRRAQEKYNRAASCQVANTSIRRRSSAAERLNPDPALLTSDGPNGVGYPLITGRSQDRSLPSAKRIASSVVMWTDNGRVITGVAQGQRAGLITPRSLDRNQSPVQYTKRSSNLFFHKPERKAFCRQGSYFISGLPTGSGRVDCEITAKALPADLDTACWECSD